MEIINNKPQHNVFPSGKLWCFFGKPKVGKSTFASSWNKSLMIDLENGTSEIECDVVKPRNLDEIRKFLSDPQLKNFDTIVIDTFDIIYSMITDEVINRMNAQFKTRYTYIGEFPMGAGWANTKNGVNDLMKKYFYPLMNQGKNIILLLHEKSELVQRKGEKDKIVYNISLPGQAATLVTGASYTIGRVYIEENGKNFISFSPAIDMTGTRSHALAGKRIPLNFKKIVEIIESYKDI
jgi:GTPase SAR1 family protein